MKRAAVLVLLPARRGLRLRPRRGPVRRVGDRHRLAGLRRDADGADQPPAGARGRDGDAAAAAHLRRQDALRRQLRAGDRRRLGRARGRPPRRLVLLRQRDRVLRGRGRAQALPRRPHLVGPPRLGGRDARPGRRRRPSRSRSAPAARARSCRSSSSAWAPRTARATRSRRACATPACATSPARTSSPRVGQVLRILVGRWSDVRQDIAARQLEEGPEVSGVFAKPNAAGSEIELIDADGEVERTLGPASGLVAATGYQEYPPTWLITGTDDVGVAAAAATLTEDGLRYHFALAIEAGKGSPAPARDAVTRTARAAARCTPPARERGRRSGAWRSARCRSSASTPRCWSRCSPSRRSPRSAAGLGRELRRTAAWGVPFALAVVVINALVTRDGATVFFRGWNLPWVGQFDVTRRGDRLRRRARAADPGHLRLRGLPDRGGGLRRAAARRCAACPCAPGVTAALAMRLFGVLGRDAARATRTRSAACPAAAPRGSRSCTRSRPARWTARPTSPRRSRCAASAPACARRGCRGPWSRHDFAFAASAVALFAIALGVLVGALGAVRALSAPVERR